MGCLDRELSILFTDDRRISELNKRYLSREGPTNVIAFPMSNSGTRENGFPMLGDVVISLDTAVQEAEGEGEPLEERVCRLLIHGILHLLGHDHEGPRREAVRMQKEEARLFSLIKEE